MYDICFNLPDDVKKKLPMAYRIILASERKTKNFCEFSSIDQKLKFFHYIGLNNSLTIFPDKSKNGRGVNDLLGKYEEEKLAAATREHVNLNVYVTNDKQTAFMVNLMAQTIHSNSYLLNLDYNKTGYHINKWSTKIDTNTSRELTDCADSANLIVKTMCETALCLNSSEVLFGINSIDMTILMHLYGKRHIYVTREKVWEAFDHHFQKRFITMSLKRLLLNDFIIKHPEHLTVKYTIGSLGIDMVNRLLNRVIKNNEF
jgi:hypothetical protein